MQLWFEKLKWREFVEDFLTWLKISSVKLIIRVWSNVKRLAGKLKNFWRPKKFCGNKWLSKESQVTWFSFLNIPERFNQILTWFQYQLELGLNTYTVLGSGKIQAKVLKLWFSCHSFWCFSIPLWFLGAINSFRCQNFQGNFCII